MIHASQIAAVLLSGGESRRMGRDKAFLSWGLDNRPLWEVQLEKLALLEPAEILISARPGQSFTGAPALHPHSVVVDDNPGAGPLAALLCCFNHSTRPYVLPLAVDQPFVTSGFLSRITGNAGRNGLVFQSGRFFEPFPALYPRETLLPVLRESLAGKRDSMQQFISDAVKGNLLATAPLLPKDSALFKSLNTPEDLL